MILSTQAKCILIRLARHRINAHLLPLVYAEKSASSSPESIRVQCGAFVSLYVKDKLRGCIGTFSEDKPLYVNVEEMALSAATTDSRFAPVVADELEDLKIEISVLSPRVKISGPEDIILGKHGIYIRQGTNRGTLLPQVAINQKWSVEQFLGNCAKYKAGLEWDGWRSADLYTYEAIVFNSGELNPDC
jgi:AmmeMemoRadiSam system protein A